MHPADIFILAVIAFSIWKGFRRGLVREAIALLGWVAGIVVALNVLGKQGASRARMLAVANHGLAALDS